MRAHPQLPIIQEHGCLALARIAFDEVQQLKVRHPNASEATAETKPPTVAAHQLPLLTSALSR